MALYRFRPLVPEDLNRVSRWRAMPQVIKWWGEPDVEPVADLLADPRVAPWIVELDEQPFAYAQDYDVHGWVPHPFGHLPPGARGIDQFIGEPDMLDRGHGSAFVRQHVEMLYQNGAPAVGTDPHPDNHRARRAFRKAGFEEIGGPVKTQWGLAILMECWRADASERRRDLKARSRGE